MEIGYQWYIKYARGSYTPQDYIYSSVEKTKQAINTFIKGTNIPLLACGIDKVENDDGAIETIEEIIVPSKIYYEDDEYEEEE